MSMYRDNPRRVMLRPISYRAAARRLRQLADQIERHAEPITPRDKATLTRAIHSTSLYAQHLSLRHRRSK